MILLQKSPIWERQPALCAAAIIALTTIVRFWFIASGQLDLVQDEAQYWDWTRRLQLSYYSKGPLIAWLISLWTAVFGDTELGVRFAAVINSCLAQIILYTGVGHLMRRPLLGLWTLVVANTTPLFIASGILMTTDSPLLVCWAGAMMCLYWMSVSPRNYLPYVLLGTAMALGILAKYMMLAMPGIAILYALGLRRQRMLPEGMVTRMLIALGAGTVIGFLPILIWNMQNDFVGFRHVAGLAGVASPDPKPLIRFDRFPEYIGAQIGLVSPWWFVFMLAGAWRALRVWRIPRSGRDMYSGLRNDMNEVRQSLLFSAAFWPLWGFFIIWSFHTRIYPNWSAMSYVAGMILCASALERSGQAVREAGKRLSRLRMRRIWVGLGMLLFVLLYGQNWLPLPSKYNPAVRLKGWTDLSHKLEELQNSLPDPQKVFYFSKSYDITAALAFYAPGQPVTYCADFGRRMSQYDLWPTPEDKKGWDAIYVQKDNGIKPQLKEMFASYEVIRYKTTHRDAPGREFTIVVLRDFNGKWPREQQERY
ncbi:ArnT family glycosyltransferase [Oleidesulfovibrio sp.]|uniref:ArnT family glycosyltransferase n=1 Tax=Oleidesulfovibrio sp. TaxID=2909707 RepID=UPI003A894CA1